MEVDWLANSRIDREKWDAFVEGSPEGSIYAKSTFLDVVHPAWQGLICRNDEGWLAIWPLFPNKKWGIKTQLQPPFSQQAGIMFKPNSGASVFKAYQFKNEVVEAFLTHLPGFHLFDLNFSSNFDYPLSFYWQGFDLMPRYTYVIRFSEHMPGYNQIRENHQRNIKKAQNHNLVIDENLPVDDLTHLADENLVESKGVLRGKQVTLLGHLASQLMDQELAYLRAVKDQAGNLLAIGLFGQSNKTTYYLMGVGSEKGKGIGAVHFLLWESIHEAKQYRSNFDFEGSMIPSIEHFFRGFGAQPVPYLRIRKNQLPLPTLWKTFGY